MESATGSTRLQCNEAGYLCCSACMRGPAEPFWNSSAHAYHSSGRDGTGGLSLNIDCRGEGRPAVIFESGLAASALSWTFVQPEIARFARACSYDRAGLGFSPRSQTRRTLANITDELRDMLRAAGVNPPYVFVGHSYGGLILRHFAERWRSDVAGLVFVDPVCASQWCVLDERRRRMLERGVLLSRRGAWLARLGVVRLSLSLLTSGQNRIPRLIAKAASGSASSVAGRLAREVGKLPREIWPLVKQQWSQPKCFAAMADYLECLPENAAAVSNGTDFGELSVVVISSSTATEGELREHKGLAGLSSRGRHVVAENSGHWIPFDRPDLVVEAVEWVLARVSRV